MAHILPVAPIDVAIHELAGRDGEMIIQMELGFDGRLNEDTLSRAFDLVLDVEPVLGCRLVADPSDPHWQPVPRAQRRRLMFTTETQPYYEFQCTGLNADENVQVAACLCRDDESDRLLIKMTHEAGDGVSLQLLASRLGSIYTRLCTDPTYRPETNSWSQRDLTQLLAAISLWTYLRIGWQFATFSAARILPRRTHTLPLPHESKGPWTPVIKCVPRQRVAFLSAYGKLRGATLNDMFLAAAYRALAEYGKWDGTSALRISMTVDLRRWCRGGDSVRSVCNLSWFEQPVLGRHLGRDFDQTLGNVAALTRRRKASFPGLISALVGRFLIRHHLRRQAQRHGSRSPEPRPLTLSNEGRLDKSRLFFGSLAPSFAHILPPFLKLPHLHICMTGYDGALTLAVVTPQNGCSVVEGFLTALLAELPGAGKMPIRHKAFARAQIARAVVDARRTG